MHHSARLLPSERVAGARRLLGEYEWEERGAADDTRTDLQQVQADQVLLGRASAQELGRASPALR